MQSLKVVDRSAILRKTERTRMQRTRALRWIGGAIHDNLLSCISALLGICVALLVLPRCEAAPQRSPGNKPPATQGIRHSEVIFARTANPKVYQQYGATLVAWGFRSWSLTGEELTSEWRRQRDLAHHCGYMEQWDEAERGDSPRNENGFLDPLEKHRTGWTDVLKDINPKAVELHEAAN